MNNKISKKLIKELKRHFTKKYPQRANKQEKMFHDLCYRRNAKEK